MILSAIAAQAQNRVIGKNNQLPWDIPGDLKYFKEKTKGHVIIMGRKTFESFGGRLLPNRKHIVLTQQKNYSVPAGVECYGDLQEALDYVEENLLVQWPKEVFIIGGAEIYARSLSVLDRIYLTEIEKSFEGDTYFPLFDKEIFKEVSRQRHDFDPPYSFVIYERIKK